MFCVKLKTNAVLIREHEAARIRDLGVESIQVSIYSHRPEVHDAITLIPGSLKRSLDAIRFLKSQGLKVIIANVLMTQNMQDYPGVRALAAELGVECSLDPTVTPMMDGNRSILDLGVDQGALRQVFRDASLVGDVDEFCAIPAKAGESELDATPCSAGHTACYVSPYGEVFPCVQFPLPTGNVRQQRFVDIWRHSEQMNEVRSIRLKDLTTCPSCSHVGNCTRCPGLAYLEGNMRGPSSQDCGKSFARTGVPSANMLAKKNAGASLGRANLVQIRALPVSAATSAASAIA
jgi:radical SAM protein with 4Fe4S-binding SPASM domain